MPLSGLSIGAIADHVVVREGGSRWHAESGQYLLAFEGDPAQGSLRVIEPAPASPCPAEAGRLACTGRRTGAHDAPEAPCDAYQRAIAADPTRQDARINLGRLAARDWGASTRPSGLSRRDRHAAATIRCCSTTSACCSTTWTASRMPSRPTKRPCKRDPKLADCHYNLALLYEELEQPRAGDPPYVAVPAPGGGKKRLIACGDWRVPALSCAT